MSVVPVPAGRASVEDDGRSLRVTLPPRRSIFLILFMAAWLIGWYFGETSALGEVFTKHSDQRGFLVFWLTGWTIGGILALSLLLWMTLGRETIELRPDALVHRRAILGIGPTWEYTLDNVANLRVGPASAYIGDSFFSGNRQGLSMVRPGDGWGITGGTIVFDYGARTYRVGAGIDEAEAADIVEKFRVRNPRLRAPGMP